MKNLLYFILLISILAISQQITIAQTPATDSAIILQAQKAISATTVSTTTAITIMEDAISNFKLNQKNDYFLASAIHSVSGEKPANEFFDIYFVFHYWGRKADSEKSDIMRGFSIASVDVAFSNVQTDSVGSTQKKLSEAGISMNAGFSTANGSRELYTGIQGKIFNGVPFWGVHLGGMETNSTLLGSYLSAGVLWSMLKPNITIEEAPRQFQRNIFVEFALHSPQISFLKYVRIKGGILIPWTTDNRIPTIDDVQHRIAVEVPVGGIFAF